LERCPSAKDDHLKTIYSQISKLIYLILLLAGGLNQFAQAQIDIKSLTNVNVENLAPLDKEQLAVDILFLMTGKTEPDRSFSPHEQVMMRSQLSDIFWSNTAFIEATPENILDDIFLNGFWFASKLGDVELAERFFDRLRVMQNSQVFKNEIFDTKLTIARARLHAVRGEFDLARGIAKSIAFKLLRTPDQKVSLQSKLELIVYPLANVLDAIQERDAAITLLKLALNKVQNNPSHGVPDELLAELILEGEIFSIYQSNKSAELEFHQARSLVDQSSLTKQLIFDLIRIVKLAENNSFQEADELLRATYQKYREADYRRVRHREINFLHFIAKVAERQTQRDWYEAWMLFGADEYLKGYKYRISEGWPISVEEKLYLADYVIDLINIEAIPTDLRFQVFQLNQELQIAYAGYRSANYSLITAADQPIQNIQESLDATTVYISILSGTKKTVTWAITKDDQMMFESPVSSSELRRKIKSIRKSIETETYSRDNPEGIYIFSNLLWAALDHFPNIETIYLTPAIEMSRLSVAALPIKQSQNTRWLIERYAIAHLPSARFVAQSTPIDNFSSNRFVGIGAPNIISPDEKSPTQSPKKNNLNLPLPLPDAYDELTELGIYFSQSTVHTGIQATEHALAESLDRKPDILSISTHSIALKTGMGRTLALLLSPSNSTDGYLTPQEIDQMSLENMKLVALSACNTSNIVETRNQEAYVGLASRFVGRGARNVLTTHWPVYSIAAKEIMLDMMRSPGKHLAAKLQKAMKNAIKSEDSRKTKPKYWAAFTLVGFN